MKCKCVPHRAFQGTTSAVQIEAGSGEGFNRVGRQGGDYVQGAKGSLVKMQSGNPLNEPKM